MTAPLSRLTLALTGLSALIVLATGLGSSHMPPDRVVSAILGQGVHMDRVIVWTLRLPRICLAVLAGMALALAGALLQRVTRNAMAAPSVLGVTDGAALGVVTFLWAFSDAANLLTVSIHWQPVAAATGAILFAGLVALLVRLAPGGRGPLNMILYGVALAALAKAAVTLMMILGPVYRATQAMTWLTGSVGAAHWADVGMVAAGLALCAPVLGLLRRDLAQLALDRDTAAATGLATGPAQAAILGLAVLLTAMAVAQVGAVGFIGLIAPHLARRVHGQFTPGFLVFTALVGGMLLLGADTLARLLAPPLELPAGALTALVGAPLFLWLLTKGGRPHA